MRWPLRLSECLQRKDRAQKLVCLNAAHTRREAVRIEEAAHTALEFARTAACPEVVRIAARRREAIRNRAVLRRQAPDPDRIARKTRRESQPFRQIRNGWEAGTYSLNHPRQVTSLLPAPASPDR
jgi:hypothetical protein